MRDGCPGCGELSCLCHSESCSPGFVVAALVVWKLSQCLCESASVLSLKCAHARGMSSMSSCFGHILG